MPDFSPAIYLMIGASVPGNAFSNDQRIALQRLLGAGAKFDEPLAPKTSMKLGGPAACFAEVRRTEDLVALLAFCEHERITWSVLGFGSNVLVPDEGFPGVVVRLGGEFAKVAIDGTRVRAGGAAPIVALCRDAAKAGLTGAEALVGIPGTVGGAVRMNAGTDVEIGDVVDRVEVLVAGEALRMYAKPEFAYRRSTLDRRAVVCAVELVLQAGDPAAVRAELNRRIARRNATQPLELPNFGSVFKNPPGDHAARLIETAGCKGWHTGGAKVSEKHANFIVNTGGATCADVLELIERVRSRVQARHGVSLELEVHILGPAA